MFGALNIIAMLEMVQCLLAQYKRQYQYIPWSSKLKCFHWTIQRLKDFCEPESTHRVGQF